MQEEAAMSRRVYLLGVGLALVALAFVLTDALLWEPGVTAPNVRRIRAGMTLAEVNSVLGPPVQDEMRLLAITTNSGAMDAAAPEDFTCAWEGPGGYVAVRFDADERVREYWFSAIRHESPLARLRAWLGW